MRGVVCLLATAGLLAAATTWASSLGPQSSVIPDGLLDLPLHFEANRGQSAADVDFLARGDGYHVFLRADGATLALLRAVGEESHPRVLQLEVVGANREAVPEARGALTGKANYIVGNDPSLWRTDIPLARSVYYAGVYPGIDLVYYGNQRRLQYDFVLAPGARPETVRLRVHGAQGRHLGPQGDLILELADGEVAMQRPVAYQDLAGRRTDVSAGFVLHPDGTLGFSVGAYDPGAPLIIDPVVGYASYLGGTGEDRAYGVAVDGSGNVYVVGATISSDYPVVNPYMSGLSAQVTILLTKISADGSSLVYSTYFGGNNIDWKSRLAVDSAGHAYITGQTRSTNLPMVNAYLATKPTGIYAEFLTKFNLNGNGLLYSTYFPGYSGECGMWVDDEGKVLISGRTQSSSFPLKNQIMSTGTGYVSKFDTTLSGASSLLFSTRIGGGGTTVTRGVGMDGQGNIYLAGETTGTDFPTTAGALQETFPSTTSFFRSSNAGGFWDAVVDDLGGYSIMSIAADPVQSGIVYVGTSGGGGMFKSTDAGQNWSAINNGLDPSREMRSVVVDYNTPQVVYVGTVGAGVFKSIDGGQSWTAINSGLTSLNIERLVMDPVSPATLYALQTNQGIHKSTDGGATWTAINNGIPSFTGFCNDGTTYTERRPIVALAVDPTNTSILYAGEGDRYYCSNVAYGGRLFRSTNGGASWTQIYQVLIYYPSQGNYLPRGITELLVRPDNPSTLYMTVNANGVFKSTDSGYTWETANTGLEALGPGVSGGYDYYALAMEPGDPDTLYIGIGTSVGNMAAQGVYKTTNGAASWQPAYCGLTFPTSKQYRSVAIDAVNHDIVYTGVAPVNGSKAWVAAIAADYSGLLYATYLGGIGAEAATGLAVAADGHTYVTGYTTSANFPLLNPLQSTMCQNTGFVAKINPAGSALVYSTYLGGISGEATTGIGVDACGNAYVAGYTSSPDFPLAQATDNSHNGSNDGFLAVLNPDGDELLFSTYFGGSGDDNAQGVAVDSDGNAYVAGWTTSSDLPVTAGVFDPTYNGSYDVFLAKYELPFCAPATPTPTETATPVCPNLGFESGFQPAPCAGGDVSGSIGGCWSCVTQNGSAGKAFVYSDETSLVRTGSHAQGVFIQGGYVSAPHRVALLGQQIAVTPGNLYRFEGYMRFAGSQWYGSDWQCKIGIDPDGDLVPPNGDFGNPAYWSDFAYDAGNWNYGLSPQVQATGSVVTVWVHLMNKYWSERDVQVYLDDFQVIESVPPTATPTSTDTPTNTPSSTPSNTPTATDTPTNTPSNTPSSTPTRTPTATNTPTNSPTPTSTPTYDCQCNGSCFHELPSWADSFDASWGSAASWSIVGGGYEGNALQVSRTSQGSSVKTLQFTGLSGTATYTVSLWMRANSFGASWWMEAAAAPGAYSAHCMDDAAACGGPWPFTLIQKFDGPDGGYPNGNGNVWTQYSINVAMNGNTTLTVGFKMGSAGSPQPVGQWDCLEIAMVPPTSTPTSTPSNTPTSVPTNSPTNTPSNTPTPANQPPVNVSVSPASGTWYVNDKATITAVWTDANGSTDIRAVYLAIMDSYGANNGLFYWQRNTNVPSSGWNANTMGVYDDSAWQKNGTGSVVGSGPDVEGRRLRLHVSECSVQDSGNTLTIKWVVELLSDYTGSTSLFLRANDAANGWNTAESKGSVTQTIREAENLGFEYGFKTADGVAHTWSAFRGSGTGAYYDETSVVAEGSHSQRVYVSGSGNGQAAGIYKTFAVVSGQTYTIRAYTQGRNVSGGDWNFCVNVGVRNGVHMDWSGSDVWNNMTWKTNRWLTNQLANNTWWQSDALTVTPSNNFLTLYLWGERNWSNGNSYFDGVTIMATSPCIDRGYISGNNCASGSFYNACTGVGISMSGSDYLQGRSPSYSECLPGYCNSSTLTNGDPDCGNCGSACWINRDSNPTTIEYTFPAATIYKSHVFSGWGDQRCRSKYTLSLRINNEWRQIGTTLEGSANSGSYAGYLMHSNGAALGYNVTGVQFYFNSVGGPWGTVVREIDLIGTAHQTQFGQGPWGLLAMGARLSLGAGVVEAGPQGFYRPRLETQSNTLYTASSPETEGEPITIAQAPETRWAFVTVNNAFVLSPVGLTFEYINRGPGAVLTVQFSESDVEAFRNMGYRVDASDFRAVALERGVEHNALSARALSDAQPVVAGLAINDATMYRIETTLWEIEDVAYGAVPWQVLGVQNPGPVMPTGIGPELYREYR